MVDAVDDRRKIMKHILKPKKRISNFEIGKKITKYLNNYEFEFQKGKVDESWDTYYFFDKELEAHVDKETFCIESIGCRDNCYFENINLIGLEFEQFLRIIDEKSQEIASEKLWMNDIEQQTVYDIDNLSLQVWVTDDGLIDSVYLLNF
jgi:hypothetical protein